MPPWLIDLYYSEQQVTALADHGVAAFVLCASLIRQFEFAQNVWINDRNFHGLGNERDPAGPIHDPEPIDTGWWFPSCRPMGVSGSW